MGARRRRLRPSAILCTQYVEVQLPRLALGLELLRLTGRSRCSIWCRTSRKRRRGGRFAGLLLGTRGFAVFRGLRSGGAPGGGVGLWPLGPPEGEGVALIAAMSEVSTL